VCWEPSVVESPPQPWMIGLLCSEPSRSRSVCFSNQNLFQVAVCCATVPPHWEATSLLRLATPRTAFPESFFRPVSNTRVTLIACSRPGMHNSKMA